MFVSLCVGGAEKKNAKYKIGSMYWYVLMCIVVCICCQYVKIHTKIHTITYAQPSESLTFQVQTMKVPVGCLPGLAHAAGATRYILQYIPLYTLNLRRRR